MSFEIGIVGAGNRGQQHANKFSEIADVDVVAVADIDEEAATALANDYNGEVYADYRDMLDTAEPDAVAVCVHNNLHRPVTVDAADAGCHVFCEKPIAATYTDAKAMVDACDQAGVTLGIQNTELFSNETQTAYDLIEEGRIGTPYYAEGVYSRRRGRPFIDGYGTPSFVSKGSAGGGPVIDIGTYVLGQLLYLLGNSPVERVGGATFEHTSDAYDPSLVGETDIYQERLETADYDVEDIGICYAHLEDGSLLSLRAAWHMYIPDSPNVVAGSQGGIQLDPFEVYTTIEDREATIELNLGEYERRQGLLSGGTGYDVTTENQFAHWIDTVRGDADDPIPTASLALNSMLIMEGVYQAQEAGRELSADEIAERSESTALDI